MANTGLSMPKVGAATGNAAKVAAIVAFIPSFFSILPQNIGLVICAGMVTCAAITAAVPAPTHSRVLITLYQIVRVAGLGVRYAVPYMVAHLGKATSAPAVAPMTTPAVMSTTASTPAPTTPVLTSPASTMAEGEGAGGTVP